MDYEMLSRQAREIIAADPWFVPALSNLSALLMDSLPDLNWAGFYLLRGDRLVVGPFQGRPACVHIPVGKGVCGTGFAEDRTVIVADVHQFPGHIACDSASNSELVVPLRHGGKPIGVLDLDSPVMNRFSDGDAAGLEKIVRIMEENISWSEG